MFLCVSTGTTLKKKKGNSLLPQRVQTLISVCGIDNRVSWVVMQAESHSLIEMNWKVQRQKQLLNKVLPMARD